MDKKLLKIPNQNEYADYWVGMKLEVDLVNRALGEIVCVELKGEEKATKNVAGHEALIALMHGKIIKRHTYKVRYSRIDNVVEYDDGGRLEDFNAVLAWDDWEVLE